MIRIILWTLLLSLPIHANAKVEESQAGRLGKDLTPMGAQRAGNEAGTIPEWAGGITKPPANYRPGMHHPDPFEQDKLLFTIDAKNLEQYKAHLSPGQQALLKAYPDWKMPVYPTRRSAAFPEFIYQAVRDNAMRAELVESGNGVKNAAVGIPFPIPANGLEAVFNHTLHWRGVKIARYLGQAMPTRSGDFTLVKFNDWTYFAYGDPANTVEAVHQQNMLGYFKQEVIAPPRLTGSILLVHETLDQVRQPREAWTYNAGRARVTKAPNVAYDNPGTASDGLRTTDNFDMFNGAPDRYEWKLLGKKELYIPYNAYRLHSDKLTYKQILQPGHINADLTRYELHRVWMVEGVLKKGIRHIYAKRVFYIDEDSWQIAVADHYDARGELWRVGEAHQLNYYEVPVAWHTLEVLHDLQAGRYLALGLDNEDPMYDFNPGFDQGDFTAAALRRAGRR